jgi:hypothetical protein
VNAGDPDVGDLLVYSVETDPESDLTIDPTSGIINWTAAATWVLENDNQLGVHIKVSDGAVFLVHSFIITIIPSGSPSVSISGPPVGSRTSSRYTILAWTSSDPEDDILTYDIYLHQNLAYIEGMREEALYFEGYNSTMMNLTDLEKGTKYYWMIRPYDGCTYGHSSITGNFKVNNPPQIDLIPQQEGVTGSEFKLIISCSDQDQGDHSNFRYRLINSPEGMTINENTGMIKWTPKDDQIGTFTAMVQVSDGIDTHSRSFDIEVIEGEKETSTLLLIIITVAVVILMIATVVFLIFSVKKRMDENALKREEEEKAAMEKEREDEYASYEEIYGVPAPESEEEEELTTQELRDAIHEQIEELEEM